MIYKINTIIQDYAWGSREYLQNLTGRDESGPLAELWMGVHPRGMSMAVEEGVEGDFVIPLSELIAGDPEYLLGKECARDYGNLPFLFKLLAAGEPLSIQAHPSKVQAEEGFARENAEGIAPDAYNRNYKDDNHKPEIICAITEYWAMKGFRTPDAARAYFKPWCPADILSRLFPAEGSEEQRLKSFFVTFMNLEVGKKDEMLEAALLWCRDEDDDACRWVVKLQEKYPGDRSILAPLYLNTLCLQPGEALYLPAGELHAYLRGFGVELMANSDNVLRGGLTPKYMDLAELEKTLVFSPSTVDRLIPEKQSDGSGIYRTPSREFELVELDCRDGALTLAADYPVSILVALEGSLTVFEEERSLELSPGEACFLPAGASARSIEGPGKAFLARAPRS